jgi:large subunit ribosomal protein L15
VVSAVVLARLVVVVTKARRHVQAVQVRPGFEGGQMPLQKRLPKFGFTSRLAAVTAEIRLSELDKVEGGIVTIDSLRAAGIINNSISRAKGI